MIDNTRKSNITAVLGSTNSGKTVYAIERMLQHRNGMIGLPLRLLAREVYDKVVARCGPSVVALVTGEERIVPNRTAYWICTTESMPVGIGTDFLAVDEIQLCSDWERGHVFTDRLLNARGVKETLFMGSDTMKPAIASLVPNVMFEHKNRFSDLTYTGYKRVSRLVPRSACIGFTIEEVYAIAEQIRQQRGGAAVVMGALSPRTRNAQVDLYQNGDVDFIVATDAIGMGLNLDINHVAFCSLSKFDGYDYRHLAPNELGQIAGRAGRYRHNGTFGVTADCEEISPGTVLSIEAGQFKPLHVLQWRNSDLDFRSPQILLLSLSAQSPARQLKRARESADVRVLKQVMDDTDLMRRVGGFTDVALLWEVCQLPDYRNLGVESHAWIVKSIYNFVHDGEFIPEDWFSKELTKISSLAGGIDAISAKLAAIRTWNYVAQKPNWLEDPLYWRKKTRSIEDRLSDALHQKLTTRFIDTRFSVLMKNLQKKEQFVSTVSNNGEIVIDGLTIGTLKGFRFDRAIGKSPEEEKALKTATAAALAPRYTHLANKVSKAPNGEFSLSDNGTILWLGNLVGELEKSQDPYFPHVKLCVDDEVSSDDRDKIRSRLDAYLSHLVTDELKNLIELRNDTTLEGDVKGFAFRMIEAFGVLRRDAVSAEVGELDQDKRKLLRSHGIRFGQFTIFEVTSVKPHPTRLRLILWVVHNGFKEFCSPPQPGLTTYEVATTEPEGYFPLCGFYQIGNLAVRVDILERLMNLIRVEDSRKGFKANQAMISLTGLSFERFASLMKDLGYKVTTGERKKKSSPAALTDDHDTKSTAHQEIADSGEFPEAKPAKVDDVEAGETAKPEEMPAPQIEGVKDQAASLVRGSETKSVDADVSSKPVGTTVQEQGSDGDSMETEALDPVDVETGETEVFYTFKWVPPRKPRRRPQGQTAPTENKEKEERYSDDRSRRQKFGSKSPQSKRRLDKDMKNATKVRKPRRKEAVTQIDPDHPFAALLGLKDKL